MRDRSLRCCDLLHAQCRVWPDLVGGSHTNRFFAYLVWWLLLPDGVGLDQWPSSDFHESDLSNAALTEERAFDILDRMTNLERTRSGEQPFIELSDRDDMEGYYARDKVLAVELARLLAPKRVPVSFYGELIPCAGVQPS